LTLVLYKTRNLRLRFILRLGLEPLRLLKVVLRLLEVVLRLLEVVLRLQGSMLCKLTSVLFQTRHLRLRFILRLEPLRLLEIVLLLVVILLPI